MNLEQQVCSLELSKRLKELGVPQTAQFDWVEQGETKGVFSHTLHPIGRDIDYCSAFTVAELGEMLPAEYETSSGHHFLRIEKASGWSIGYPGTGLVEWQEADSEADARARLLIHLLEHNIIYAKDIK